MTGSFPGGNDSGAATGGLPADRPLRDLCIMAALAAASGVIYLLAARVVAGELGFPLDDGWIHQVFARNLLATGQMAYNLGEPASGTTSPLWTFAIALTGWLPVGSIAASYGLGIIFLTCAGWVASRLWRLLPGAPGGVMALVAGVLIIADWHLAWAALSGMETTLFVFLSLLVVWLALQSTSPWLVGLAGGLLTLTRPEGIVLTGLAGLWLVFPFWRHGAAGGSPDDQGRSRSRMLMASSTACKLALAAALPIAPFVLFSLSVSGTLLPNTYYAKSLFYARPGIEAVAVFLVETLIIFIGGPLGLLVPGVVFSVWLTYKRMGAALLLWAWPLSLLVLYAWRLPVTYQHGRYEMPAIPFLILLGLWGVADLSKRLQFRLLPRVFGGLLTLLVVGTWLRGATVYASDVRLITLVDVQVARWLQQNTPPDAVIATHDIGAIGFFGQRRIVDTAGLITPEAASLVRDQEALLSFIRARKVGYVAQFTVWYPRITADLQDREVFRVHDDRVIAAGGDDFVVYRTGW